MFLSNYEIASRAIELLEQYGLAEVEGRPFDNSFEAFSRSLRLKRNLVVVGFNGSSADEGWTTKATFEIGLKDPCFSNVQLGAEEGWNGKKRLAKALIKIPNIFGLRWQDTIYTNAILACSKDAADLSKGINLNNSTSSVSQVINNSMAFFKNFIIREFQPSIIVCHGNGEKTLSTASILHRFLDGDQKIILSEDPRHRAYWFHGNYEERKIPILCLRHMSRFAFNELALRDFRRNAVKF